MVRNWGQRELERTGSDSTIGGVEGAVLDGGPGVIANEGLGLAETEDIVMMARLESCSISETQNAIRRVSASPKYVY